MQTLGWSTYQRQETNVAVASKGGCFLELTLVDSRITHNISYVSNIPTIIRPKKATNGARQKQGLARPIHNHNPASKVWEVNLQIL